MKKYSITYKKFPENPIIIEAENRDKAILNAMICACVPESEIVQVKLIS
jgi:hypothetical protein